MKRSQEYSQASTSQSPTPATKKLRVTPPDSSAVAPTDTRSAATENGDAENDWKKVEKRKAKKVKKAEGKLEVCIQYKYLLP